MHNTIRGTKALTAWNRFQKTLIAVIGMVCSHAGFAAPGDLLRTIPNPTPATDEFFGRTLAATPNGNILAGSPGSMVGSANAGAMFVFNRTDGQLMLTIPNPEPNSGDGFGSYVWSTASQLVAGAPTDDSNGTDMGRAYVFNATTGQLVHTLNNPTTSTSSWFGWSVNAIGEDILLGSRQDDTGADNAGAAYMFSGATGQLLKSFYPPAPAIADTFGQSVAGVGTKVLVGAPGVDIGAPEAGAAYVYDSITGNLLLTIPHPEPVASAFFGFLVRAYGNDLLVGTAGQGVYLFNGTTGQLIRKFSSPEPTGGGRFGVAIGSNGPDIFVGNPDIQMPSGKEGAVYVFNAATSAFKRKVVSPQAVAGPTTQKFGVSVLGLGSDLLVAAHFETIQGNPNAGNVYQFDSSNPVATADRSWLLLD